MQVHNQVPNVHFISTLGDIVESPSSHYHHILLSYRGVAEMSSLTA